MHLLLDQKDKSFLKKIFKAYLSINAVIVLIVGFALIYGANVFYTNWKAQNDNFKQHMLSAVSPDNSFNKMFNDEKQSLSDLMDKETEEFRKHHKEHMENFKAMHKDMSK